MAHLHVIFAVKDKSKKTGPPIFIYLFSLFPPEILVLKVPRLSAPSCASTAMTCMKPFAVNMHQLDTSVASPQSSCRAFCRRRRSSRGSKALRYSVVVDLGSKESRRFSRGVDRPSAAVEALPSHLKSSSFVWLPH